MAAAPAEPSNVALARAFAALAESRDVITVDDVPSLADRGW